MTKRNLADIDWVSVGFCMFWTFVGAAIFVNCCNSDPIVESCKDAYGDIGNVERCIQARVDK